MQFLLEGLFLYLVIWKSSIYRMLLCLCNFLINFMSLAVKKLTYHIHILPCFQGISLHPPIAIFLCLDYALQLLLSLFRYTCVPIYLNGLLVREDTKPNEMA